MKITCERCSVAFDAQGAGEVECPACHHLNLVAVPGSTGLREISLSSLDGEDEPTSFAPHSPPASTPPPRAPAPTVSDALLADDVDFATVLSAPALSLDDDPAPPQAPMLSLDDEPELPAPKKAASPPPRPAVIAQPDVVDLPAPRKAPPPIVDLPAPKRPPVPAAGKPSVPPPMVGRSLDSPRPPVAPPPPPPAVDDMMMPLDLDAPDVDDAPLAGADVVDLPAPRFESTGHSRNDDVDLPAPRLDPDADLPAPKLAGETGDASADDGVQLPDRPSDAIVAQLRAIKAPQSKPVVAAAAAPPEPPNKKKLAIVGGGVAALVLGGAIVAYKLDLIGGGGAAKAELQAKLASARKAIADDTLPAFRRAAQSLKPLSGGTKPHEEAALLEAQIHLLEAHLGATGEIEQAKVLLDVPPGKVPLPDRARAEGLRALDEGDFAAARTALQGADATTLSYLGWAELEGRDPKAAAVAFGKAVAAEPARAQAVYGLALANERLGNDKIAGDGYTKVLALVPDHARAKMGLGRVRARASDAEASSELETLLAAQSANFGKTEIAEAQESMGEIAIGAGRVDEAEERFKKAIALDAQFARSHVAWDAALGLARLRVNTGRSAAAIDDLRKLVAVDAKAIEPRLLLARALVDKRETEEAETLVRAVETLAPKDPHVALLRGELIEAHENPSVEDRQKAVDRYREAVASDPRLVEGWTALARALHAQGKTPDALDALSKGANSLSGNAHGAALVGETYLAIGQPAEAETRFRDVLKGSKPSADQLPVWLGLGESLEAQNKLDEAKRAYAEAEQLDPKSALFIEKQARIALRQNQLEEARRLFEQALKLGTPTATLRIAAADLALTQKRYDDARALVEPVVKEDDRNAVGNLTLARVELESGHPDDAIGLARRAVTLADMPEAHLVLAQVYEMTNKLDAAAGEFNLARRPPSTDRATLGRARVFVRMGSTKDALTEVGPLLTGPYKADAMLIAGDCYSDLQQPDKARKAYEDAAKLAPQSAEAAFKHGRAELDAGKRGPGLDALERAVKIASPKIAWLPDAWFLIADVYHQSKQSDAAGKAYRKYLSIAPMDAPMRAEAQKQLSLLGNPGGAPQ